MALHQLMVSKKGAPNTFRTQPEHILRATSLGVKLFNGHVGTGSHILRQAQVYSLESLKMCDRFQQQLRARARNRLTSLSLFRGDPRKRGPSPAFCKPLRCDPNRPITEVRAPTASFGLGDRDVRKRQKKAAIEALPSALSCRVNLLLLKMPEANSGLFFATPNMKSRAFTLLKHARYCV